MDTQDRLWIIQIKEGGEHSEQAFRELTVKYGPKLYAQIMRITRNVELSKDVLQNVFVKIWKNLSGFKEESNLYTWMYRIAYNESMSVLKKENKHSGHSLQQEMIEVIGGSERLDGMSSDEIYDLLREAIIALPEKQALVFELKYFEDLKYSEIAKITNTSEGSLKASFHIAKDKITKFLERKLNH